MKTKEKLPPGQIIMVREIDMTGMKLKPIVCALTIGCAAISNAGCNVDGTVDSLIPEANPAVQYASASGAGAVAEPGAAAPAESAATEHPTQAEARHFAVYNLYRAMAESSGGSGTGSTASASGAAEDAPDNFILWGSRLFGIEHLFCPAESLAK
jgi:hypothetical protein